MSLYEYKMSRQLVKYDFGTLLMALMENADSVNSFKLQNAFPEIWRETQQRYNAPGGILDDDKQDCNHNDQM